MKFLHSFNVRPRIKVEGDGSRFYAGLGAIVVLIVFGGLIEWSLIAPLDGAVVAPATVTVESNRKAVQHLEGGIVQEIHVKEGLFVQAGDLLVALDNTVAQANVALMDGQFDALAARRARLVAERDGQVELRFPVSLKHRINYQAARDAMAGQFSLFKARRATRQAELELLKQRVSQHEKRIEGIEAQAVSKRKQWELLQRETKNLHVLYEKGFARLPRILELEREAERLNGERASHIAEIAEIQTAIGETQLEIIRVAHDFREEVVSELRDVETQLIELLDRRVAAEDTLRRTEIRAPRAGRVLGLNVHTIGGVVAPGEALMEIVPDDDVLVLSAQVQPRDIDKVLVGSNAIIRFSAFNQRTTPEFRGAVIKVSADRLFDAAHELPYYSAIIEIPREAFEQLGSFAITPGMPAETFIRTGERTVISYFLKPLTDSLARALREE